MLLKRKTLINANYINYLLNIFDGKLNYQDIVTMPLSLLTQLQKSKEDELETRAKNLKKQADSQANANNSMTITNTKRRYKNMT